MKNLPEIFKRNTTGFSLRSSRYVFLDGIRGLAALFVMTRHVRIHENVSFFRSYLAVDLFFILSGFVIAHAYDEKVRIGALSFRQFMLTRLVRFYPFFLIALLLCAIRVLGHVLTHTFDFTRSMQLIVSFVLTAMFIPNHISGNISLFPLNGPVWSLFFELVVNAIYAIARPIMNNIKLLVAVILGSVALMIVAYLHKNLAVGDSWDELTQGFVRAFFGIFCGLLLYRFFPLLSKFFHKLSPWFAVMIVCLIFASPSAKHYDAVIDVFCVIVIFPACVLIGTKNISTNYERLLLILGSASYPIYVLHVPLARLLHHVNWVCTGHLFNYFIFISGITFLSVWLEKNYDIPLRRFLSKELIKKNALQKAS
jgi:peptidoglycan/LPS O-acetylase OafA/YrhL